VGQNAPHPLAQARVVARFIPGEPLLGERERPLAETLEREVVEVALAGEVDGRLDPVAGVARAGTDADGHADPPSNASIRSRNVSANAMHATSLGGDITTPAPRTRPVRPA